MYTILANNYPVSIPKDGMHDLDFGATPLLFQPLGLSGAIAPLTAEQIRTLRQRVGS